jgi:CBS domain-containing protein
MVRTRRFLDKTSMTQSRERGSNEFESRLVETEGSLMSLVNRDVVTVSPTTTIKAAAEAMTTRGFRRLPVADPGTRRLLGIIGSSDIIDFLGGGEKFKLIQERNKGNFLAAINEPVKKIMEKNVLAARRDASVKEALSVLRNSRRGGLVIVDEENLVKGIVTERDFVLLLANKVTGEKAGNCMTNKVITATPDTTLGDVVKAMVRNSFRRLPIVSRDNLAGIVTTRMIISFLGRNGIFSNLVGNTVEEVLKTRCRSVMSTKVAKVSREDDLGYVAGVLKDAGVGTACVVKDSRLEGIITERDIINML